MAEVLTCKRATARRGPAGLEAMQVMPGQNLHCISTSHKVYGLFTNCCQISLGMQFLMQKNRMYSTDSEVLLAYECFKTGVSARRSKIQHGGLVMGRLHAETLRKWVY